jgi:serine/threonine-protein kinase HipA
LNGLRAHGRYDGSYEGIAERIAQFVSLENQRQAFEQFFATVALSCAIGNGDAHLKNFALLYEHPEAAVRLAPAFDLVCTTLYRARDVLALTLADSKSFPDRKRLMAFARSSCGLGAARTIELLNDVTTGIKRAIQDLRRYVKKHADFARPAAKLIAAFEHGAAGIVG